MIRRSTLIAVEIVLGLVAALAIGLGVAWWRFSQGPIELNSMRDQIETELSEARSGRPVGIERVELTAFHLMCCRSLSGAFRFRVRSSQAAP
jgi:hypothetical protein